MKILCFVFGVLVGTAIFYIGRTLGVAQAPEEDQIEESIPVRYSDLRSADEWMLACNVRIFPLKGIYSDRQYCVIVIVPKINLDRFGTIKSTVYLSGFSSKTVVKPVILKLGDEISPIAGRASVKLLDFSTTRDFLPFTSSPVDIVVSSRVDRTDPE